VRGLSAFLALGALSFYDTRFLKAEPMRDQDQI
jgi:hypothetical protein